MFSSSGTYELLFLFYCLLDPSGGECIIKSLYLLCCAVIRSVCLCVRNSVCKCVLKQLTIFLVVVVILLLNVMEVLIVVGGPLLSES